MHDDPNADFLGHHVAIEVSPNAVAVVDLRALRKHFPDGRALLLRHANLRPGKTSNYTHMPFRRLRGVVDRAFAISST